MAVAINTMDAIKKKMQAMKLEKENAFDKADQLEQKLNEQKLVFEKVYISTSIISHLLLTYLHDMRYLLTYSVWSTDKLSGAMKM